MLRWFTNFTNRKLEWALAGYTTYFGLWLSMPPLSMNTFTFERVLSIAAEETWGVFYLLVGITHLYALHVDGRCSWTPFIRSAILMVNSIVFMLLALGIAAANPYGAATATYSYMVFGFFGIALCSAAFDMGKEVKVLQYTKQRAEARGSRGPK